MIAAYEDRGVRFRYPTSWQLEQEDTEAGWTLTLQSPNTAFILLSLREDMPAPAELADSVYEALRQEYPSLESEEAVESVAGQPAVGHDIRFFSFDLTNTCWTRCFRSDAGTLLLMCQANDLDLETQEPVMRAICASLQVDE